MTMIATRSIKGKRTSHRSLFGGGEIAALLQGKDRRALESWRAPEECTEETWNADADPSLTKSKGCPCCFNCNVEAVNGETLLAAAAALRD